MSEESEPEEKASCNAAALFELITDALASGGEAQLTVKNGSATTLISIKSVEKIDDREEPDWWIEFE